MDTFPEHRILSHPCDAYISGKCVANPPLDPASVERREAAYGICGLVGVQRPFWMAHFIWFSIFCWLICLANGELGFRFIFSLDCTVYKMLFKGMDLKYVVCEIIIFYAFKSILRLFFGSLC